MTKVRPRAISCFPFKNRAEKKNFHNDKDKVLLRKECVFRLLDKGAIYFVT